MTLTLDFDFSDITFDDVDFGAGLDLEPKIPPPIDPTLQDQTIYPEELRSPLFLDWEAHAEDMQCAALGWFLEWRKRNPFKIEGCSGRWTPPPEDRILWEALEERMIDWAFLEKGGLDLEATHTMLLKRHRIRLAVTPIRPLTPTPAGAGTPRKETPDVRKPQQSHPHRQPGPRPRVKDDPERYGAVSLLDRDDRDLEESAG